MNLCKRKAAGFQFCSEIPLYLRTGTIL